MRVARLASILLLLAAPSFAQDVIRQDPITPDVMNPDPITAPSARVAIPEPTDMHNVQMLPDPASAAVPPPVMVQPAPQPAPPTATVPEALPPSMFTSEPLEEEPPPPTAVKKVMPEETPPLPTPPSEPRPEYDMAVLQGLKKVTAETSTFEVPLDTQMGFGTLSIIVKKCIKSLPEERPENSALILIRDNRPGEEPITVFSGWMFSSSPAISALEHPVYDITMIECTTHKKKPEPEKAPEKTVEKTTEKPAEKPPAKPKQD